MRRAVGLMPQKVASCLVAEAIIGAGKKDFAESGVFFVGGLAYTAGVYPEVEKVDANSTAAAKAEHSRDTMSLPAEAAAS